MKGIFVLFLLLITGVVFASISPESFDSRISYGGETIKYKFIVSNDFSYDANVLLDINLWNESNDLNGMDLLISPGKEFRLKAYSLQSVLLELKPAINIKPELYGFTLTANYYLGEEQVPIRVERVSSSGGHSSSGSKIVYVDNNIYIEKTSQDVNVKQLVYVDRNVDKLVYVYVDKNESPATSLVTGNQSVWGYAGLILIVLLVIGVYYLFIHGGNKNGNTKE